MENNTSSVLVSVCVITYNHEAYIVDCLDSILNQKTNFNFNIFISDDCSTDKTLEIITGYSEKYDKINVLSRCGLEKSKVNGKNTGNKNFIDNINRANGVFIATCDGDDVWSSELKLQKQIDLMLSNKEIAIVCSSKNKIINNKLIKSSLNLPDFIFPWSILCFFNPIPSSSVLFRKDLFKYPNEWFFTKSDIGDWPLWFSVSKGKKIFKISESLINYRIHSSGTWGEKRKSQKAYSSLQVVKHLAQENSTFQLGISMLLHTIRYSFLKILENIFYAKR
jgi:glycosyltransferase involved in cell wall biosynthesis